MNINFSDKEIQVIQLIVPELTPEETCNTVLRDWFNANVSRLPTVVRTTDQIVDDVLVADTARSELATVSAV